MKLSVQVASFLQEKKNFTVFFVVIQQYNTEWWIILWMKQSMGFFNSAIFFIFPKMLIIYLDLFKYETENDYEFDGDKRERV